MPTAAVRWVCALRALVTKKNQSFDEVMMTLKNEVIGLSVTSKCTAHMEGC